MATTKNRTKDVISHKDVLDYFSTVTPEMASLVHDLAGQRIRETAAKREALVNRLSKARKAKGHRAPAGTVAAPAGVQDPSVQADVERQFTEEGQPPVINRRVDAQRARRQRETQVETQVDPNQAASA